MGYATAVLAVKAKVLPEDIVQRGKPISFGGFRQCVANLAKQHVLRGASPPHQLDRLDHKTAAVCIRSNISTTNQESHLWHDFLAQSLHAAATTGVIKRINDDRNDIAHGREARSVGEIRNDIANNLIQIPVWKSMQATYHTKPPSHEELSPWLAVCSTPSSSSPPGVLFAENIGIFEKWTQESRSYIIPWSGHHFVVHYF